MASSSSHDDNSLDTDSTAKRIFENLVVDRVERGFESLGRGISNLSQEVMDLSVGIEGVSKGVAALTTRMDEGFSVLTRAVEEQTSSFKELKTLMTDVFLQLQRNMIEEQASSRKRAPGGEGKVPTPSCEAREGEGAPNPRRKVDFAADLDLIDDEQQQHGGFPQSSSLRRPQETTRRVPPPSYGRNEGRGGQNQLGKWVFQEFDDQIREEQQQQPPEEELQQSFTRREGKEPMVLDEEDLEPQAEKRKTRFSGLERSGGNPSGFLHGAQLEGDRGERENQIWERFENISPDLENPDLGDPVGPNWYKVGSNPLFDEGAPKGGSGTAARTTLGPPGHPHWLNTPQEPRGQSHPYRVQQPMEEDSRTYRAAPDPRETHPAPGQPTKGTASYCASRSILREGIRHSSSCVLDLG